MTPCPTCVGSPRVGPTSLATPSPTPVTTAIRPRSSFAATCPTVCATCCPTDCSAPVRARWRRAPAGDFSAHALAAELDELCAEHGFGRLDELTYDEVEGLVGALDAFERDVSARRRVLHDELDVLTEAFVGRLQDAAGPAEENE